MLCACGAALLAACGGAGSAPRLIAPLSTATVTSQRPTLRWQAAAGSDVSVEICGDRACTRVEQRFDVHGDSGAPPMMLLHGVHFWHVRLAGGTTFGATWEFVVGAASATVDTSWGTIPDVDGDGQPDVIVGTGGRGAYVYLNGASGLSATPTSLDARGDLPVAGDVNGDGFVDVIDGSPSDPAQLFLGSASGLRATTTAFAGTRPIAAGDVNRDGYADVLDGAALRFGSAAGLTASSVALTLPPGSHGLPRAAGVGDFNGDGYGDVATVDQIAMGPMTGGNGYLYLGGPDGLSTAPIALDSPTETNSALGFFVITSAGDVNGDGLADVAMSAHNLVYVFLGASSGAGGAPIVLHPPGPAAQFAVSLSGAGDVDADGFADVIVGDWGANGAFVYHGSAQGLSATPRSLFLASGADEFGYSVAGAGDLDGDGIDDLIVGAPGPISTHGPAAAYIYYGRGSGGFVGPTTLANPGAGGFGWSVARLSGG
ncbi:MAG: FG-GAP-like repeat-containing protein, partial [Deltaproteobacteria bacterium]